MIYVIFRPIARTLHWRIQGDKGALPPPNIYIYIYIYICIVSCVMTDTRPMTNDDREGITISCFLCGDHYISLTTMDICHLHIFSFFLVGSSCVHTVVRSYLCQKPFLHCILPFSWILATKVFFYTLLSYFIPSIAIPSLLIFLSHSRFTSSPRPKLITKHDCILPTI